MAKEIELRRHTDDEDDALSGEGVRAAVEIGRRLRGGYALAVSTGAQRATQTVACLLAGLGQPVDGGVVVEAGLRSQREERWRELYAEAGSGEIEALRGVDPGFVDAESQRLGDALRRVLDALDEGARALAVGHSPTNEAAVYGLTGTVVEAMGKGAGVVVTADERGFRVEKAE